MLVAAADQDGLADWIFAIPNCVRYSERWRDFSNYDIDPRRSGAPRWRTPYGELAVRLAPELPEPVNVQVGGRVVPVRPLTEVLSDDPRLARIARRACGRRGA